MRKYLLIFLLAIQCSHWVFSQQIRILDRSDLQPIEHVLVFNHTRKLSFLSNRNGEINFNEIADTDTLLFQHASYQEVILTYAAIRKNRNVVMLSLRSYDLQQLTVSAHRWDQNRDDIPVRVLSMPAREVVFQNPQTAADLLSRTNEVFVQKSQLGGGSPMLRGFAANSVLIVVDGVRMNNAIYRGGNLHNIISLDPNVIDNTEVFLGPGSVMYGSDALGGVMVFHTLQPHYSGDESYSVNAKPMIRYSSANQEQTAHLLLETSFKKWAFATSFTHSDFDNLRTGSNRTKKFPEHGKRPEYAFWTGTGDTILSNDNPNVLKPTGYNQWNFTQKIRFKASPGTDLNYGFHYSASSDIPRYDRLIEYRQGHLRFGDWYYGPQRWMMHNLQISFLNPRLLYNSAKIIAAYQFNEESRYDRRFGQAIRTGRREKVQAYILNADFNKAFSPNTNLYYGFEGLFNDVNSSASILNLITKATGPASTRYPDGKNHYVSLALYGFVKRNLNERMILNTGLRYTYVSLNSNLEDTTFYTFPFREMRISTGTLSGSAGIAIHPFEYLQVNLNLASGFRAPNLDDAGKIFESEPGNVVVPNPDLKPEYTLNSEVGFILSSKRNFRFELNLFYTLLYDVMVRRDFQYSGSDSIFYNNELSRVQAIVNAGKGEIAGVFAGFTLSMGKYFELKSSATYTHGIEKGDAGNIPLKHIPPLFGATTIGFRADRTRAEASVVYNVAKPWDKLDPSEQAKTFSYTEDGSLAWTTFNLKASYQLFPQLQINAGIENIFDKHYWPYASGIPAPGRNVYVALRGNLSK